MGEIEKVGMVIANSEIAKDTAKKVEELLKKKRIKVCGKIVVGGKLEGRIADAELVLAFGGDKTILQAFHMIKKATPVLGINCGESGYLMDITQKEIVDYLPAIIDKRFLTEERERLEFPSENVPYALNDIVIAPVRSATIMNYNLKIDKDNLWKDMADGVILSTSTGSTAYNMSSGGPLVSNTAKAFAITPINSLKATAPLVVSEKNTITIFGIAAATPCEAIIDGTYRIRVRDSITIKRAPQPALLARIRPSSYVAIGKKNIAEASALSKVQLVKGPPAAKFILKLLELERSMTQKEIIQSTQMPARTVRRALIFLIRNKYVIKNPSISDFRQDVYIYNVK